MKEKLTNNFGIKLLSLVLASIMWIVIINLDDPVTVRRYQNIPVEILNEKAIASLDQVYDVVEGRTVELTVKGKRSIIDKIRAADLKASVDLSNISSFNKVEITASCEKFAYENLEITAKPKLMQITLEDRDEKQVNVRVVTKGTPPEGYSVGIVEAKPVMLAISGARSVVARIEEARVTVDVSGETETFTRKGLTPTLYDADGREIDASRLKFNKETVSAKVNILKTKRVPVTITTAGKPAQGYGVYQIDYDPQTIEIAGTDEDLSAVRDIPIEINVENRVADVEQTVALNDYLPKGIRVTDDTEAIAVKVTIKQMETREFYLNPADITVKNLPEGLNFGYVLPENTIRVSVMGMEEALRSLLAANLGAYIDLEGLTEGVHQVKIQFGENEELHFLEQPEISIKLSVEGTEEEEPDPGEEEPVPDTGNEETP